MMTRIRLAQTRDAAEVAAIYEPYVTDSSVSFEWEPPDAKEIAARISKVLESKPWLVYLVDGAVAGYAYASSHRDRAAYQWSVEVSAYTHPQYRRAGIARALYEQLFLMLAGQGYYNAYAGITLPNDASVGFHAALGFEPIGVYRKIGFKHGQWHDVAWFARALREHDAPQSPPASLPRFLD